jgi:uncharacterized protein (TIGR02996 family)
MEHEGLLDALRDDPEQDGLRLVFADWLDDHGEAERAEYIRVQLQMERLLSNHPDWPALAAREHELRQAHVERFLGVSPALLYEFGWRGGLVDRVRLKPDVPLAAVETLFHRHPVRLLTVEDERLLGALAASPVLGLVAGLRVPEIAFSTRLWSLALDRLLGSPHLRLRTLEMVGNRVDHHLCRVLSQSPGLKGLRCLCLRQTRLDDAGVLHLLRAGALPRLESWHVECATATALSLTNLFNPIHAPRWRCLAWPALQRAYPRDLDGLHRCTALEKLDLTLPYRRHDDDRYFGWLGELTTLRELHLAGPLDAAALAELAGQPGLARLRVLQLRLPPPATSYSRAQAQATLAASEHLDPATQVTVGG